ncbi:hypothetical protein H5407_22645 [Mitsuaria sp. WAJ17]|uniref:hypothetical protein n=1 Tax=Mitsuaria sp. WAJ17 TaxID=2761452 RepID=UPI0016035D97|nr:hypothetical protein [Mitsuaria sp. WAJ17]MBB2488045.1 hypothetical protein [Mitsuaria sp. WAJ17]
MRRARTGRGRPGLARALSMGLCLLAPWQAAQAQSAEAAEEDSWRFTGSYRALGVQQRPAERPTQQCLAQRLRLSLAGALASWPQGGLRLQLDHDSELLAGNGAYRAALEEALAAPQPQALRDRSVWWLDAHTLGRQQLFRAFVQARWGDFSATLGRQRVALGQGRFWSSLDLLNPPSPQQIEREDFIGVDALLVEQALGPLSRASLVLAPMPGGGPARWLLQWRTHAQGVDLSFSHARYGQDRLLALDLAGQWADAGLRAELTRTAPAAGPVYLSGVLGADYAFNAKLSASLEWYWRSRSVAQQAPGRGQARPPQGAHAIGLNLGYELTPLLKLQGLWLRNTGDGSQLLAPGLSWSLDENAVLSAGLQRFSGTARSEYGPGGRLAFVRYQRYF